MDPTTDNSPVILKDSTGYINEAVICCDESPDGAPDGIRRETTVDCEGTMNNCDELANESDDIGKEVIVHTEDDIGKEVIVHTEDDIGKEVIVHTEHDIGKEVIAPTEEDIGKEVVFQTEDVMHSCDKPSYETDDITMGSIICTKTIVHRYIEKRNAEGYKHREINLTPAQNLKKNLQNRCKEVRRQSQPTLERTVSLMPAIIAAVSLILLKIDQDTDIYSAYNICTVPCKCIYSERDICTLATDMQELYHPCVIEKGNKISALNYCNDATGNKTYCNDLDPWFPTTPRHLQFCLTSIGSILLPSIINSTYLYVHPCYSE